jgi:VWFA-related protein
LFVEVNVRTRLSVLACIVVTVATVAGRQSQSTNGSQDGAPVFRAATNLIRVDMYATRNGAFVTDLHPEDIDIFEDGVRQNIETFELVQIGPGQGGEAASDGQDSRTRIYIVFVDTHTAQLADDTELRRNLLRFLDRTAQPTDLVGLMTPDMSAFDVVLGRKNTVMSDLANEVRWLEGLPSSTDRQKDFQWENCYSTGRRISRRVAEMKSRRDGRTTLDSLRELVERLRDLREERKAVLLVTGGWPFDDQVSSALADRPDSPQGTGRPDVSGVETKTCADDRRALLRVDFGDLVKDLARSANRANVSFYPVNSRPSDAISPEVPAPFRNQLRQRDLRTQNEVGHQLRDLAEITDGSWGRALDDIDRMSGRIVDDTSHYYLIGYQSTNQKNDSKFREITIKVRRPGVVVRSRPGYGGETVRIARLGTPPARPLMDSRVTAAFEHVQRFEPGNPMLLRTSTFAASGASTGGAFWVVGESGNRNQRWSGGRAEVIVSASDRREVFSGHIDLGGTPDAFNLRVPETGTLPLGSYSVRIRILRPDESAAPLAQDFVRLELASGAVRLGEPLLLRRGPLVRDTYRPTADPRFRRVERLRLEYPTDTVEPAVARVLDRMGQPLPLPVQLSRREDVRSQWVVADLPLTALAPGDYAVSMTDGATLQVTAFRIIP